MFDVYKEGSNLYKCGMINQTQLEEIILLNCDHKKNPYSEENLKDIFFQIAGLTPNFLPVENSKKYMSHMEANEKTKYYRSHLGKLFESVADPDILRYMCIYCTGKIKSAI